MSGLLKTAAITALLSMVGAPANAQAASQQSGEPVPFTIPADIAEDVRPYLDCIQSVYAERVPAVLFDKNAKVRSYGWCANKRDEAKSASLEKLGNTDPQNEAYIEESLSSIDTFFNDAERSSGFIPVDSNPYTIPDGMWEYHVCQSASAGQAISLNGEKVEPRFPEDPDCGLARIYSREQALLYLERSEKAESAEARAETVDRYVEEIDDRTAIKRNVS